MARRWSKIRRACSVIPWQKSAKGTKQYHYLPFTLEGPPDLLDPMAQVTEQLAQHPGPLAESWSCSGSQSKLTAFWVRKQARAKYPKWGLCCPPNPKRLNRCHAPFLVVGGPGCNNLSFILEKNLPPHPTPPDPWKSHRGRRCLNFCQIYFCLKFCQISHPLACKHHYW